MTVVRMHALTLAATLLAAAIPGGASALDLQVMVPNLKPEGRIVFAAYNDPAQWNAGGKPFATAVVPVEDGMAKVRFQVPEGRYAVVAFQDRNDNGQLDTLAFGWPSERVGYSGGARPWFGRPSWDRAEFGITEDQRTTVFVRLK